LAKRLIYAASVSDDVRHVFFLCFVYSCLRRVCACLCLWWPRPRRR
jgi:hypothetical protein